ncbi:MAG: ATP-binding cassette domain-containing protein [Candidatus Hinthialibacter antarcticus]|nr:ATP-binding cassette domain-containing protein [Candidatus Hinthialibacter antarcticus]
MVNILTVESASCFKGVGDERRRILDNVSFSLPAGAMLNVLGPSGSGKSTLLRVLIGLDPLESGRIIFQDREMEQYGVGEWRRRMGLVLQLPHLFAGTVSDNLLFGPRIHRKPPQDKAAFVSDLLQRVGLPQEAASRNSNDLSVGQQMRVSLARTLANAPDILLLDEPSAALDRASARQIVDLILKLNRESGVTVIVVNHQIDIAQKLGGAVLFFDEGASTFYETIDDAAPRLESLAAMVDEVDA